MPAEQRGTSRLAGLLRYEFFTKNTQFTWAFSRQKKTLCEVLIRRFGGTLHGQIRSLNIFAELCFLRTAFASFIETRIPLHDFGRVSFGCSLSNVDVLAVTPATFARKNEKEYCVILHRNRLITLADIRKDCAKFLSSPELRWERWKNCCTSGEIRSTRNDFIKAALPLRRQRKLFDCCSERIPLLEQFSSWRLEVEEHREELQMLETS